MLLIEFYWMHIIFFAVCLQLSVCIAYCFAVFAECSVIHEPIAFLLDIVMSAYILATKCFSYAKGNWGESS